MAITYEFCTVHLLDNQAMLDDYCRSLGTPMDSYVEDNLDQCTIYSIIAEGTKAGFLGMQGETIWFFYATEGTAD